MLYQWLNNSIIKTATIGHVIEMLGSIIETLKEPSTIEIGIYYINQLSSFGQIFRVPEVVCHVWENIRERKLSFFQWKVAICGKTFVVAFL